MNPLIQRKADVVDAALDAMRKAHESEVNKEVEKFKKEFMADHQSKASIGVSAKIETRDDQATAPAEGASQTAPDEDADNDDKPGGIATSSLKIKVLSSVKSL